PWVPVAAAGAGLLIAGAALVFMRGAEATPVKPSQQPIIAVQVAQPPATPQPARPVAEAPRSVTVPVSSVPSGATVSVGGKALGTTPMDVPLPPGGAPVEVTLELSGYDPVTRQVSASDSAVELALEQQRPRNTKVTPVSGKKQGGGLGGIKGTR
ncbi:PEGA domain-containing protein, partial [Pyxidicoccus sp. 3LFB2]